MESGKIKKVEKLTYGQRDYRSHHYRFRLNDEENKRFEEMFERSGEPNKTRFIVKRLFGGEFVVRKQSVGEQLYYQKLSGYLRQFQGIANNYNQLTRAIHKNFSEPKAIRMLTELKRLTGEMAVNMQQVVDLTEEAKGKWSSE